MPERSKGRDSRSLCVAHHEFESHCHHKKNKYKTYIYIYFYKKTIQKYLIKDLKGAKE